VDYTHTHTHTHTHKESILLPTFHPHNPPAPSNRHFPRYTPTHIQYPLRFPSKQPFRSLVQDFACWSLLSETVDKLFIVICILTQKRGGKFSPVLEYAYFPYTFFANCHTSQALMFIYCRYISIVAKIVDLQISHCAHSEITFPYVPLIIQHIEKVSN